MDSPTRYAGVDWASRSHAVRAYGCPSLTFEREWPSPIRGDSPRPRPSAHDHDGRRMLRVHADARLHPGCQVRLLGLRQQPRRARRVVPDARILLAAVVRIRRRSRTHHKRRTSRPGLAAGRRWAYGVDEPWRSAEMSVRCKQGVETPWAPTSPPPHRTRHRRARRARRSTSCLRCATTRGRVGSRPQRRAARTAAHGCRRACKRFWAGGGDVANARTPHGRVAPRARWLHGASGEPRSPQASARTWTAIGGTPS